MGNCCLKGQFQEPNKPVSAVHISSTGAVKASISHQINKSSKQPGKSRITSPNGPHVPPRTLNVSPTIKKGTRHKPDHRRARFRSKYLNVPSNTHIGGNGKRHKEEDKRHGKLPSHRDKTAQKLNNLNARLFSYNVLKDATNNFSRKNFVGEGGFGDVYKGFLAYYATEASKPNEGLAIAVKRLIPRSLHGYESWKTEVDILSKLSHPNIVQLIGCCKEERHKMVVYEYMSKGSLDSCLFRDDKKELNWRRRVNIAIGAAKGLAYLHTNQKPIIHRDIKASNVLLDSKFNAKISDFGLAKYGPLDENDHLSTKVFGTKGYIAPEYFRSGHLTAKTDVYSFGVVLLEILSGSCVDKKCSKGTAGDLVQRSKPILSKNTDPELRSIIDIRLKRNVPMEEAHKFASLTYRCLSEDPKERPTMNEVVVGLEKLQPSVDDSCHHYRNQQRVTRLSAFTTTTERDSKPSDQGRSIMKELMS